MNKLTFACLLTTLTALFAIGNQSQYILARQKPLVNEPIPDSETVTLRQANLIHDRLGKICTHPGLRLQYEGSLGTEHRRGGIKPKRLANSTSWLLLYSSNNEPPFQILAHLQISRQKSETSLAKLVIEKQTYFFSATDIMGDKTSDDVLLPEEKVPALSKLTIRQAVRVLEEE